MRACADDPRPVNSPETEPTAPCPGSGSAAFHVVGGEVWCEGVRLADLAERHGTPLYVYSEAAMRERYAAVRGAFGAEAHVCYAVKSNPNLAVLRTFGALGTGFDVVSAGELARVRAAGQSTAGVVFAGVAKAAAEIDAALDAGILFFNVESEHELPLLEASARARGLRARLALRLNPDVEADTHAYISTGKKENKFGLDFATAGRVVESVARSDALELVGYHVHLGSQLRSPRPYLEAFDAVCGFLDASAVRRDGVRFYDLGGGFGISYGDGKGVLDVGALAAALLPRLAERGLRAVIEPGRFLVGDAGVLITRVLGRKAGASKRFLLVDAAMNDLLRPSLYGAEHPIVPVQGPDRAGGSAEPVWDVVGPVCESGDFLGRDRRLPALERGDLLAVLAAGAYGASMASNYNSRPRPAEVLVSGGAARVVRRRERVEDLWAEEL